MNIICLENTASTNTWLSEHLSNLPDMTLVVTSDQTAGRGQRGNKWEAEPGKNLTLSLLWRPKKFPAANQFLISEAVSLAIVDTLSRLGIETKVKWPNDIYVGDDKIAGILIENAIAGRNIMHTIIGIGLNVNQTEFVSDAPNPVSMRQAAGHEFDLSELLTLLSENLRKRIEEASSANTLHNEYTSLLWRGDGKMYPFATPDGNTFMAAIAGVAPDGTLSLIDETPLLREYLFKQVAFLPIMPGK